MPKARRGEIWMADLGMVVKGRPVLILSVEYQENERAVVTYVARTTSTRGTQYEVQHEARGMPSEAFDAPGIASIPDVKLERRLGEVNDQTKPDARNSCPTQAKSMPNQKSEMQR